MMLEANGVLGRAGQAWFLEKCGRRSEGFVCQPSSTGGDEFGWDVMIEHPSIIGNDLPMLPLARNGRVFAQLKSTSGRTVHPRIAMNALAKLISNSLPCYIIGLQFRGDDVYRVSITHVDQRLIEWALKCAAQDEAKSVKAGKERTIPARFSTIHTPDAFSMLSILQQLGMQSASQYATQKERWVQSAGIKEGLVRLNIRIPINNDGRCEDPFMPDSPPAFVTDFEFDPNRFDVRLDSQLKRLSNGMMRFERKRDAVAVVRIEGSDRTAIIDEADYFGPSNIIEGAYPRFFVCSDFLSMSGRSDVDDIPIVIEWNMDALRGISVDEMVLKLEPLHVLSSGPCVISARSNGLTLLHRRTTAPLEVGESLRLVSTTLRAFTRALRDQRPGMRLVDDLTRVWESLVHQNDAVVSLFGDLTVPNDWSGTASESITVREVIRIGRVACIFEVRRHFDGFISKPDGTAAFRFHRNEVILEKVIDTQQDYDIIMAELSK